MTSYGHFWNISTFGGSRAIRVLLPKMGAFRKSKLSQWRNDQSFSRLWVLGGQIIRLYGTIWGGATHLRGCGTPSNEKVGCFRTFAMAWRVLWIHWFYQGSVHRCVLEYSAYLGLDFWISHRLATCWADKCRFLRFFDTLKKCWLFKVVGFWNFDPRFGMKVSIYVTQNNKKSEFFSLVGLWAMTIWVISPFGAKT